MQQLTPQSSFSFIQEQNDFFLSFFPHRYDYIWSERPTPGQKPQWQTESRHPLSDRQLNEGVYLYGVRFGPQTQYLLLDIDIGSPYHPKSDRLAIARMVAALEPLGLVSYVACSSSYSGGLHLYFPFADPQKSWDLAFAVQSLLERAGFDVRQGWLELFPNPKLYVPNGTPGLYAAHRLPLQEPGSYLLNGDWTPYSSSRQQFVTCWQWAFERNLISAEAITATVEKARHKHRGLTRGAGKFLNDLDIEIEQGWTGHGQTNRLLGRIAMRSYIFGHVLYGSDPLEGSSLIRDIVQTAQRLPGYQDWCRHQHEIEKRAEDWARCIENSDYFPYRMGSKKLKLLSISGSQSETQSWNQKQSDDARTRIREAIAHLLNQGQFPSTTTLRFKALVSMGIGGGTLYRHRDLWHPEHLVNEPENFGDLTSCEDGTQSLEDYVPSLKSLLEPNGRNTLTDNHFETLELDSLLTGRNQIPAQREQPDTGDRHQQRMQEYLISNDPILVAEAQYWLNQQPSTRPLESLDTQTLATTVTCREDYQAMVEAIAYHITRLGWTAQQISQQLMQCFGKPLQALLTDYELSAWLNYLAEV